MIPKVRKAVFPAAGLGTRFLPATKAQPKEMLPLVDKPLIQYGVEEAMQSGVQNIIIVTGRGKSAIEDHFDVSFELEHLLEAKNKKDLLATVRAVSDMIDVSYVRQKEALGLGHAVLRARELVGDEPFAVILSDDVIDSETPCLRQLLDVYEFYGASVVALMEVPGETISAYGVVDAEPVSHNRQGPAVSHPQHGGETQAIGSAVEPGDHRPLRADARGVRVARSDRAGKRRRDPVDRRSEAPAAQPAHLRVSFRRHALRRRRQARVSEGHGRVRAAALRSGWSVPRISEAAQAVSRPA